MTAYLVLPIRYTDRPRDGRYTEKVCATIPAGDVKATRNLTPAREYAYHKLSHSGFNKDGKYMCIIIKNTDGKLTFVGEVLNTAFDDRYWYPSNDGVYASAGKYPLYKNGTLGKRLR